MNIDLLLLGLSAGASILGKSGIDDIRSTFNANVANYVNDKAEELYSAQLNEAREELLEAKTQFGAFASKESAELESQLIKDPLYLNAKAEVDAAKAAIATNEAILKAAKEDSTAISVGSGDNSIAVKISNETAKAKAAADLKAAKADYKAKSSMMDSIKKGIKSDIISKRTPGYYQASAKLNEANTKLCNLQSQVDNTKNELYSNPDIMRAAAQNAGPISSVKVVGLACVESALPCYMLYKIWHNVYEVLSLQDFCKV